MSRVMAHMVAGYPDRDRALAVARGLIEGGAVYLEIQFPFSDPTADGRVIQAACQHALENGFTVDQGFTFVGEVAAFIASSGLDIPIYIMSYASLVVARGVQRFLQDGVDSGAHGFILPDLPIDYDEGAYQIAAALGTRIMPVLVTSASESRLALLENSGLKTAYVALRTGITGGHTEIGRENLAFLDSLANKGIQVMAGFGVSRRDQVIALDPHVHAVIVGSALVSVVRDHAHDEPEVITSALRSTIAELVG